MMGPEEKMQRERQALIAAVFAVGALCGLIGAGFAMWDVRGDFREAAIEHGCAAYDTQTGDWHWIERTNDDE